MLTTLLYSTTSAGKLDAHKDSCELRQRKKKQQLYAQLSP